MQQILWEGDTAHGHYQVVDCLYDGRPARVLYSGDGRAAQSGIPKDASSDLLFDYNQRLFELAVGITPKAVLVIGGGVGTLPKALLEALPDVRVDVVEPDEGLTVLAYDFFDLPVDDRMRIYHTDGRTFLREHSDRYDMVVLDAFNNTTIPKDLKTLESFRAYRKHLRPSGVLAANVISGYYGPSAHVLQHMYAAALRAFDVVDVFLAGSDLSLWLPQNFILTAQGAAAVSLGDYILGELIKPPEVRPDIVLYDEG